MGLGPGGGNCLPTSPCGAQLSPHSWTRSHVRVGARVRGRVRARVQERRRSNGPDTHRRTQGGPVAAGHLRKAARPTGQPLDFLPPTMTTLAGRRAYDKRQGPADPAGPCCPSPVAPLQPEAQHRWLQPHNEVDSGGTPLGRHSPSRRLADGAVSNSWTSLPAKPPPAASRRRSAPASAPRLPPASSPALGPYGDRRGHGRALRPAPPGEEQGKRGQDLPQARENVR